jgi:hypothetical protein
VRELPMPARLSRLAILRLGPPMLRPEREYEARRIEGDGYSMLVFDGLLDWVADRELAARVRHSLIGGMPPRGLWLTHSEGARELERYIRTEGADLSTVPARIAEVDATLEESRILSWEYLQMVLADERAHEREQDAGTAAPASAPGPEPIAQVTPPGETLSPAPAPTPSTN